MDWYVYILSNRTHRLYVGSTNELARRYREHIEAALKRERQVKLWSRWKKVALIQSVNPNWYDLGRKWHRLLRVE